MLAVDREISRIVALRTIRGNLLRLKWHAAVLRFELALRRHHRALKYSQDQPRAPAGVPEEGDGQPWTAGILRLTVITRTPLKPHPKKLALRRTISGRRWSAISRCN